MYDRAKTEVALTNLLTLLTEDALLRLNYHLWIDPTGREVQVSLFGPDTRALTRDGGELLCAFEHLASEALRVESVVDPTQELCLTGQSLSRPSATAPSGLNSHGTNG